MKGYMENVGLDRDVAICAETFFAGTTELGTTLFTCSPGYWPSTKFLCPECGDMWAVRFFDSPKPEDFRTGWTCQLRSCPVHGDGSLITWNRDRLVGLPHSLCHYELINSENWIKQ